MSHSAPLSSKARAPRAGLNERLRAAFIAGAEEDSRRARRRARSVTEASR